MKLTNYYVKTILDVHYQGEIEDIRFGLANNAFSFVEHGKERAELLLSLYEQFGLASSGQVAEEMVKIETMIKKGNQNHEYCKNRWNQVNA